MMLKRHNTHATLKSVGGQTDSCEIIWSRSHDFKIWRCKKETVSHFHSSVSACLYCEHAMCHKDIISFVLLFDVIFSVNVYVFKEANSWKLVKILLCCLPVNKGGKIVVNVWLSWSKQITDNFKLSFLFSFSWSKVLYLYLIIHLVFVCFFAARHFQCHTLYFKIKVEN